MNTRLRVPMFLAFFVMFAATVQAHHAVELRDATPIRLQGNIVFVSWDGAHVMYRIEAPDDRGEIRTWDVLGASPKILRSRGIAKSTFRVGEHITITGRYEPHTKMIAPDRFINAAAREYEMGFYPRTMLAQPAL